MVRHFHVRHFQSTQMKIWFDLMAAASSHRSKRRAVRKHRRDLPRPINDLVTSPNR